MPMPKRWPFFILVLLGAGAIFYLKQNKPPPEQVPLQEVAAKVRTLEIPAVTLSPQIVGRGTVRPVRTWEAVAQVKGKIVEKHPRLQKGAFLEAGTLILRVDPSDYRLAVARIEAELAAARAQLVELDIREQNGRASLAVEQQSLELIQKELERKRDLVGRGGISRSDVEGEERALLAQRQKVLMQESSLNLIPAQRSVLQAQLAAHQAGLDLALIDLQNTEIRIPFAGRIAQVNVEQEQYVREGEVLGVADDLERAEVEAQFPVDRFAGLIRSGESLNMGAVALAGLTERLGLEASVVLRAPGMEARWSARVARISDTLDPKTRTIGVIVEVEGPYRDVQPGVRPPLLKGMFVEVELGGRALPNSLVVPRHALQHRSLLLVNPENRLEIRPVEVTLLQPDYAVIGGGVQTGERVVVSDLIPAIEGMLLDPVADAEALQRLLDGVGGGTGATGG